MIDQLREKVREAKAVWQDPDFSALGDYLTFLEARCELWRARVEALRDEHNTSIEIIDGLLDDHMKPNTPEYAVMVSIRNSHALAVENINQILDDSDLQ